MRDVIKYFIEEPEKEYHIRKLAKIIKKSPTTVSKYLKKLEEESLIKSRKEYNHLLFKVNTESQKFKDLKLYYNIKNLRASGLIDYLINEFNNPEAICLFGSYYKAEDTSQSDIDILIITPIKKSINVEKYERILKRKIQLFVYSNKEINKMKLNNKELLNNMINGINLCGFWEVFK